MVLFRTSLHSEKPHHITNLHNNPRRRNFYGVSVELKWLQSIKAAGAIKMVWWPLVSCACQEWWLVSAEMLAQISAHPEALIFNGTSKYLCNLIQQSTRILLSAYAICSFQTSIGETCYVLFSDFHLWAIHQSGWVRIFWCRGSIKTRPLFNQVENTNSNPNHK